MSQNQEFYIQDDYIQLHAKLDFPNQKQDTYPIVVLFHGLTGHMEERHIVSISKAMNEIGFVTLRVDLYGHGKSDGQFCDHTLLKWVNNGLAVMEYVKTLDFVDKIYVSGHSQGGLLAMILATIEPTLYSSILLLSPACVLPEAARQGHLLDCYFDPKNIPDTLTIYKGNTIKANYIRTAQFVDIIKLADSYLGPVLIIHGEQDDKVPIDYSFYIAQRYDNAKLELIADENHNYERHLDQVIKAIQKFLLKTRL